MREPHAKASSWGGWWTSLKVSGCTEIYKDRTVCGLEAPVELPRGETCEGCTEVRTACEPPSRYR
eukprot:8787484-Pyramimonas_sp.AAC.1